MGINFPYVLFREAVLNAKLLNILIELWFFKSKEVEFKLCFAELSDSTGSFQGFGRQIFFVMKSVNEIIMVHIFCSPNVYA